MDFFTENWVAITSFIFGGGGIGTLVGWVIRDRKIEAQQVKKGAVEVKQEELDYANETRLYFLNREADYKAEKEELRSEMKSMREEFVAEKNYYREKQGELRTAISGLQDKFDKMALNYALEVEKSDLWKQKYYELDKKYTDLKTYCTELETKIEALNEKVNEYERTHE
jgi:predicted nuclease with TOPRIM domain